MCEFIQRMEWYMMNFVLMINEQFYFSMLLSFSVLSLVFIDIEMTSQIQISIAMKYISVSFRDSLDIQKQSF